MLKQELKYHFKRIFIVYMLLLCAFLLLSISSTHEIAYDISNYTTPLWTWTQHISDYFNRIYTLTYFFIIISGFYYILRIALDYRQGKTRWLLLAHTQKKRMLADIIILSIITITFYILSLMVMYLAFQYFVSLLDSLESHSSIPTTYQSFSYMFSTQEENLSQTLYVNNYIEYMLSPKEAYLFHTFYPNSFAGLLNLISCFLSFILAEVYTLHILKENVQLKEALSIIAYIVIMTIMLVEVNMRSFVFIASLTFSLLFIIKLETVYTYRRLKLC